MSLEYMMVVIKPKGMSRNYNITGLVGFQQSTVRKTYQKRIKEIKTFPNKRFLDET